MTLNNLLAEKGIAHALIVDDVCDSAPTAQDLDPGNEVWPTFNDDLTKEQRSKIVEAYPIAANRSFDELLRDDKYISTIWNLRNELGDICKPVFENYITDQNTDQGYISRAIEILESLGLKCKTAGRDFNTAAQSADLILIDLFFSKIQDDDALEESKTKLREALSGRIGKPPLVILMSRSTRLKDKREEFRDEVGLLDSAFRIISKDELAKTDKLVVLVQRLSQNYLDSLKLANYFYSIEKGMKDATSRTLSLLRRLSLSDIGQIQQLLLSAEGEPTGSYLVDVFDRVLQHEIERDSGIISAAIELNEFSVSSHPPPYVAGTLELQELVQRLVTQNSERLRLPGALEASVAFGDILKMSETADIERLKSILLVDLNQETVLLVLTPACDLQRCGAPRILLLVGKLKPLGVHEWTYRDDARTPVIRIGEELRWIKWNLKHIDTVSHEQLQQVIEPTGLQVVARLRESHVLELQQKVLSGLGRVGMMARLPATFSVKVEAYFADINGVPSRLNVPALDEGAVCFVGRDEKSEPVLRLIMTEHCCDNLIDAYTALDEAVIAVMARPAFAHVRASNDFRQILTTGINLKGAKDSGWHHIPLITESEKVSKLGLLAWNYVFGPEKLGNKDLSKAGIIILLIDSNLDDNLGFKAVVQSGLIQEEPD